MSGIRTQILQSPVRSLIMAEKCVFHPLTIKKIVSTHACEQFLNLFQISNKTKAAITFSILFFAVSVKLVWYFDYTSIYIMTKNKSMSS